MARMMFFNDDGSGGRFYLMRCENKSERVATGSITSPQVPRRLIVSGPGRLLPVFLVDSPDMRLMLRVSRS